MSTSILAVTDDKAACSLLAMGTVGERVRDRRKALGMSQPELAKKASVSYQAIQQIEAGGGTKHVVSIAKALGVNAQWLEDETGPMLLDAPKRSPEAQEGTADRLRILGMGECGDDGWSLWNGETVGTAARPPNLMGAVKAFAVYVIGDSMYPRYIPGELVYVHPGRPVVGGSFVLVQKRPTEDGEVPRAVIKQFIKEAGSKTILRQFNPEKTFEVKTSEIQTMDRIVGSGDG